MLLKPTRFTVAIIAIAGGVLMPAAGASAATLRGTVVHENARAHSFVLAGPRGALTAIHARHLPALGRSVIVAARRLRNGTWTVQHVRAGHKARRVRVRGIVTYVNPQRGTFVVSTRGASLLVHERRSRRHDIRLSSDSGVQDGEVVTVDGDLDGSSVEASSIQADGERSSGISLEGSVEAVDTAARTLSVSADDDDESGAVVTVQVPSSFDLGAFTIGEPVELTASLNPDGTYTLGQSSDDSNATTADNQDDTQTDGQSSGDSHRSGSDGSGAEQTGSD